MGLVTHSWLTFDFECFYGKSLIKKTPDKRKPNLTKFQANMVNKLGIEQVYQEVISCLISETIKLL